MCLKPRIQGGKTIYHIHFIFHMILVARRICTGLDVHHISLLDSNTVVVSGKEGLIKYKMKCLSLQTGGELDSVDLAYNPSGIAMVQIGGGKCSVAVSDW